MNVRDTAIALTKRGYFVVPLIPKSKAAAPKKWQDLRLNLEGVGHNFPEDGQGGVGILLSVENRPDCYVLGVDIDTEDPALRVNIAQAFEFEPPGKRGKKGCTYFVQCPHSMKKAYFKRKDPTTGKMLNLVEILGDGQQTVMPPSIHPETGEPYTWIGKELYKIDVEDLPVYSAQAIQEIKLAVERPGSPVFQLNSMQYLGSEGGGDVHNSVLAAVAALVTLQWDDEQIWARVDRATRRAVEAFDEEYNWPGWEVQVRKMVEDARNKGFGTDSKAGKKERIHRSVARWFMNEFTGDGKIFHRDARLAMYRMGAFDMKPPEGIRHLIATKFPEPDGVSLNGPDWNVCCNTIMDLAPRFPEVMTKRRVCLQNGTFDMDTGELNPWNPEDFLISRLDFELEPDATCPVYEQFLETTFANLPEGDKELSINTYEEFVAHSLFECLDYHRFLVIKGQPRTGKSTLVNIARMLHGEDAVSAVAVHDFANERYRTAMVGKLLNLVTEVAASNHAADDFLKAVTAGDLVQVRYLYAEPLLVKLPTRLIIACNEMFRTRDTSGAIEARMLILSCENAVDEGKRDIKLMNKLRKERAGIFLRMQKAWKRLEERGRFYAPSTSAKEIFRFTMENNHVQSWMMDRCVQGRIFEEEDYKPNPADLTETGQLYLDYVDWAKTNGFKQISSVTFGMKLTSLKIRGLDLEAKVRRMEGRVVRCRNLTLYNASKY